MKHFFFSLFAFMLIAVNANAESFKQFNSELEEGDYVIAYNTGSVTYAMKATVASGRLGCAEVTPVDGEIGDPDAEIVWHIAKSGDYWTIYNASVGKYAAGTGVKNKADLVEDGTSDNALWTASDAYEFINKLNDSKGVNKNLRNNATYGFACYSTTTGGPLVLYKKVKADELPAPAIEPAGGIYYEAQNVTLTAGEGCAIYYSLDGDNFKLYQSAITIDEDATLYAYAKKGDNVSSTAKSTYQIAKHYDNLSQLCKVEPVGQPVVVELNREEIVDIYVSKGNKNGIYFMVGSKKIEVFCYNVPEAWQIGGLVSGTLKGLWKDYKGTWEVCPSNWDGLSYIPYSLQNGLFDTDNPVEVGICTYEKDKAGNGTQYAWQVPVTGWNIPANGDARAGGVFQYGSGAWLGGKDFACPETDKEGNAEGGCLGLVAVWGGTAQYTQQFSLAPGLYTLSFDVLNTAGEAAFAKNLFSVTASNGEMSATIGDPHTTFPVGQWTRVNMPFEVEKGDLVTVSLGYQSGNNGSGSAQHLFVDNVAVTEGMSKELLADVVNAAKEVVAAKKNVGPALFQHPEQAHADLSAVVDNAQAVVDNPDATSAEIVAAMAELAEASDKYTSTVNTPDPHKDYRLKLEGSEGYLGFADGGVKIVADGAVRFHAAEDGKFYIKSADMKEAVGYLGTDAWSMTADINYKSEFYLTLVDGKYTIEGDNGFLGVDGYSVGSPFYGDKPDTFKFGLEEYISQSKFAKAYQLIETERVKNSTFTTYCTYDADAVCKALEIDNIEKALIYGVESNTAWTESPVKWIENAMNDYAGWRTVDGQFCAADSKDAAVCVTIEKKAKDNIAISTIAEKEPEITDPIYNAYWVLAVLGKAVLIDVQIKFVDAQGDNATAISSVKVNDVTETKIYDLTGRQVKNINRGQVYIINGKKVILK